MKPILFFVFLNFFILGGYAQKESYNWYFGDNAGISFNSGSPVALTDGILFQREGNATISDSNGNLLFYTDGTTIWNKDHVPMTNGTGLTGEFISAQSAVIVPLPQSSTQYYVFTISDWENPNASFRYSIVDMSLSEGLGSVTIKNVLIRSNISEQVTSVISSNQGTCQNIWILTHEKGSNNFLAYLLTSTGLATSPVISSVGMNYTGTNRYGYLKFSSTGKSLCSTLGGTNSSFDPTVQLYNFDNSTGKVSNPLTLATGNMITDAYSSEFSPDNTKLYVVAVATPYIYQYDISSGDASTIVASQINIANGSGPKNCLQLGPDKKIYVSKDFEGYLGVIEKPNNPGISCSYVDQGVYLQGRQGRLGFPNFIQSFFYYPYLGEDTTLCANSVLILDAQINANSTYQWQDNSTASKLIVSNSGTYWVNVFSGGCKITDTINVLFYTAPTFKTENLTGCKSVNFDGNIYTSDTTLKETIINLKGCDSVYKTTNIKVINPVNKIFSIEGCNVVNYKGKSFFSSATVFDTVRSNNGCDSLIETININVYKITAQERDTLITACNQVFYNNKLYTTSTILYDTLKSYLGCDSVRRTIKINIVRIEPTKTEITLTGCNEVIYKGVKYSNDTIIKDTVRSFFGCDSIYTITTIRVQVPLKETITINSCNTVLYNGSSYNKSIMLYDTIKNKQDCDSIYKLVDINISAITVRSIFDTLTGCKIVKYKEIDYTSSAIVKDTIYSIQGCDSIYRITNIAVVNFSPETKTKEIKGCNNIVYNGVNYLNTTTLYDTIYSIQGCDSIYNITNLTVYHVNSFLLTDTVSGCNSVSYKGVIYTVRTLLYDTVRSVFGCDSIYTLTIINPINPLSTYISITGCNSAFYRGKNYTASTILLDTLYSKGGCDSVYETATIKIDTLKAISVNYNIKGCENVVWNGKNYINSTVVTDTIPGSAGCDSIYRITTINVIHFADLQLTVTPNPANIGQQVTLTANAVTNFSIIAWNPSFLFPRQTQLFQTIIADTTRKVQVIAKSDDNCLDTAFANINVQQSFNIPNTFSPNKDGINDVWKIQGLNEVYPNCKVFIYNRWGELLFSSIGYNTPWDGTYKQKNVPTGTYYYLIEAENNQRQKYSGWLLLIR